MHFLAHIHTKDTNFIFGTQHIQYRYTQTKWTHTDTHGHRCSTTFTFCTFCDIHVCQRYKFYIWHATDIHMHRYTQTHAHTSAETPAHTDIDTCTQTYISTHADIHRHTCIFFYIHKHTYIYVKSILPAHFIFSCHLPNELRSHGPIYFLSHLKSKVKWRG